MSGTSVKLVRSDMDIGQETSHGVKVMGAKVQEGGMCRVAGQWAQQISCTHGSIEHLEH